MDDHLATTEKQLPAFPPRGATLADGTPIPPTGELRVEPIEAVQTVGPFWFCFLVDGRLWGHLAIFAAGPADAASVAEELVLVFDARLSTLRYPHVAVTSRPGRCD